MNPIPYGASVSYLALSGLIGFAVFCGSYGYHVWRKRNQKTNSDSTTHPRIAATRRASVVGLSAGLLLMVLAVLLREVIRAEGLLSAERVTTIRAVKDGRPALVNCKPEVEAGELLVQFSSPTLLGEYELARHQKCEYEAERARTLLKPLDLDPEIVRKHQNEIDKQNQLRASRGQILPARELIARERIRGRIEKLERLTEVKVTLGNTRGALEEAMRKRAYLARGLQRISRIAKEHAVTASEQDEHRKNVSVADAEINKLKRHVADLEAEQRQLDASLKALDALGDRQLKAYESELEGLARENAETIETRRVLASKLCEDQQRAEQARQEDLRRLDMKIKQADARSRAIEEQMAVRAAEGGTVHFCEAAPQSASEDDPLLVIGPKEAFRLKLHLSETQAAALEKAGNVSVELCDNEVEPRFSARFYRALPLPGDPGYAVVELACRPPANTVRAIALGNHISARLLWRPPLWALPLFRWGAAVTILSASAIAACRRLCRQPLLGKMQAKALARPAVLRTAWSPISPPRRAANGHAVNDNPDNRHALNAHSGGNDCGDVAPMLDGLAVRLHDMVQRRQLDPALLSAVEWSLDRHHVRAIKILAKPFHGDTETVDCLTALSAELDEGGSYETRGVTRDQFEGLLLRLLRILRVLNPQLVESAVTAENFT